MDGPADSWSLSDPAAAQGRPINTRARAASASASAIPLDIYIKQFIFFVFLI